MLPGQVTRNPNASLAGAAGTLSTGIIWTLSTFTHASLTAEEGSLITVGVISGVLLLGSKGLKGCCAWIWRGDGAQT